MLPIRLKAPLFCLFAALALASSPTRADNVQAAIEWAESQPRVTSFKADTAAKPLIIAHRGASGYVPEHTLAAYALAILQGADYIETDLVMSQDGELFARHDNQLDLTTDVAKHPEFADRKRSKTVDGTRLEGWFSEDFSAAELHSLRAIERIGDIRPRNRYFDGRFEVPTLQAIIDLVKRMEHSQDRRIGLYIETKHPTHFQELGLAMERPLVEILAHNGYARVDSPVYLQSFEVDNLKALAEMSPLPRVQLLSARGQPYDQQAKGGDLSYADMVTPAGLAEIARYATGIGPEKNQVIALDKEGHLLASNVTPLVADAHAAGLLVHPYTFRAENHFLPVNLRKGDRPAVRGNIEEELRLFLDAGVDGLFIDQPDVAVRLRQKNAKD